MCRVKVKIGKIMLQCTGWCICCLPLMILLWYCGMVLICASSRGSGVVRWACLSVCVPTFLRNHMAEFHPDFLCLLPMVVALVFLWWHCDMLCTSGCVNDALFSYYQPSGHCMSLLQMSPSCKVYWGHSMWCTTALRYLSKPRMLSSSSQVFFKVA